MPAASKLLVVDLAALGWNLVSHLPDFRPAQAVFPAITCTAQASFRTAALPQQHGIVANGLFFKDLTKVLFWEQSARLVEGPRIWEDFRARGGTVGLMFWQQSMGEAVDFIATPAPIHKHSGGMIQSCYTQPAALETRLNEAIGRPFNLMNYWGPLANHKSSDWIVDAIIATMGAPEFAPDLLLTYIPHLDYDLQRRGPASPQAVKALDVVPGYLTRLKAACGDFGYDWSFVGDYAIEPVKRGAVFPNRALREAGLFHVRDIRDMAYTDFFTSRAFAIVDHQVAHVHCRDSASIGPAREVLSKLEGVAAVLDREAQAARGLAHVERRLVLVAESGAWFAYRGLRRRRRRITRATSISTTSPATIHGAFLWLAAGQRQLRYAANPRHARARRPGVRDRMEFIAASTSCRVLFSTSPKRPAPGCGTRGSPASCFHGNNLKTCVIRGCQ